MYTRRDERENLLVQTGEGGKNQKELGSVSDEKLAPGPQRPNLPVGRQVEQQPPPWLGALEAPQQDKADEAES